MPGYELFGKEEREAVEALFDANGGVLFAHGFGPIRKGVFKVREFEAAIAKTVSAKHCQVVSSGTAALWVAIRALGVKPGDEVITSSFTFVATVEAILECGAVPVLTEVDGTYNMDPEDLKAKITPKTKLILPVHMAGAPARMDRIKAIAEEKGIPVLEDAAQCFGGTYQGKPIGTLSEAGIYSFDFAKNITTGEGGAIVTENEDVFKASRERHDHGHEYNDTVPRGRDTRRFHGMNFRMTEIQAAIGLAQLKKLHGLLQAQRANKKKLLATLQGLPVVWREIADPGEIADTVIFSMESAEAAAAVAKTLGEKGVGTKNLPDAIDWHFAGTWDHMIPGCREMWPKTRDLLARSIALPVNAIMPDDEIEKVSSAVREAVASVKPSQPSAA